MLAEAEREGCAGLEFLEGIPGLAGGAVRGGHAEPGVRGDRDALVRLAADRRETEAESLGTKVGDVMRKVEIEEI